MKAARKTLTAGTKVSLEKSNEINAAAEHEGMSRSQWIATAIDRALGKKPRYTIQSRVAGLENQMQAVRDHIAEL